jgi:cell division protein FtsQ
MLGQQKALEFKKARTFKGLVYLFFRIVVRLSVLILAVAGVISFRSYLLHSPRFFIAIKDIHGLQHIPESQVLMKVKEIEERNRNLPALDLDQLRKSIELLPWVKTATLRRVLPDRLIIQIVERVPIAFARMDHSTSMVDEEGMLLEIKPQQFSGFDFPVVLGLESGLESEVLSRNQKRIALYKQLMKTLEANGASLSREVSEVHLQDADSVSVVLNEDTVLVHLGNDHFQDRFRRYLAMSREIRQKYPQVDSVDLRFENQVVINAANETIRSNSSN